MSACECGFPIDPDNKMYVAGAECICDLKGVFPAMTGAACEGCGSTSNTVFSEKWQTSWCAQPSGCNTDSYTSKIMEKISSDFHLLPPRSYDHATDTVKPHFTSFVEFKAWVNKRIDKNIERIGEELGL